MDMRRATRTLQGVRLDIPPKYQGDIVPLMAPRWRIWKSVGHAGKVVVDERRTLFFRIGSQSVPGGGFPRQPERGGHGATAVSQPQCLCGADHSPRRRRRSASQEEKRRLVLMDGRPFRSSMDGLQCPSRPRVLISILRTMKSAGLCNTELVL